MNSKDEKKKSCFDRRRRKKKTFNKELFLFWKFPVEDLSQDRLNELYVEIPILFQKCDLEQGPPTLAT